MKDTDYLSYIPLGESDDEPIDACLVLEGGAFRCMHQEGVLDALLLNGLSIKAAVGTSAGALNAYNYISGSIGRSIYLNLKYRHDSRYVSIINYFKSGSVIGFPFMFYSTLYPLRDDVTESEGRRICAVSTNCLTGEAEYLERSNCSDIYKALEASSSIPYLSKMVELDGKKLLDGGVVDRIPYSWALKNGYKKIIVIKSRPRFYREKKKTLIRRKGEGLLYKKYPDFSKKIMERTDLYNAELDELERLEREGRVFVIAPKGDISVNNLSGDLDKLSSFYFEGLTDGAELTESIKEYLEVS